MFPSAVRIEVEVGTGQIGQIKFGGQDALLAIFRPGQKLTDMPTPF
jgi:hypothetical protein